MDRYYVNDHAQDSGDHEVPKQGCYYLSLAKSTTDLGYHASCFTAVIQAKKYYSQSDGCSYCSPACDHG